MNGCKVTGCADNSIPASELKNGQLAVIVSNSYSPSYNGRIVTRHTFGGFDHLAQIGLPTLFSSTAKTLVGNLCRVRVLKAGEAITVS